MVIFILILLMLVISRAQIAKPGEFNTGYTDIPQTNVVKGIFVILVLLGHGSSYIQVQGVLDQPYLYMRSHLGQMVVSMFLFYSGFGMMKSIMKKRFGYIKTLPVKRFLFTLLNFDIAVFLFWIMNQILGIEFDWKTILLSLTGWVGIGNSNWYMFAIFVLYILLFISFFMLRWLKKDWALYLGLVFFTILSIAFVYWEIRVGQPKWCYDTVILFALGSWFALLQDKINAVWLKNDYLYLTGCAIMGVLYWWSFVNNGKGGIELYSVWAVIFTLTVVVVTMKIKVNSVLLEWFGKHVFSIYILQRIPMTVLSRSGFTAGHPYTFIVLTLLCTMALAVIFDYFVGKFDKFLLKHWLKE